MIGSSAGVEATRAPVRQSWGISVRLVFEAPERIILLSAPPPASLHETSHTLYSSPDPNHVLPLSVVCNPRLNTSAKVQAAGWQKYAHDIAKLSVRQFQIVLELKAEIF